MAEHKTLNTRIQLKYDTWANWTSKDPLLLKGEIAVCYIPAEQESGAAGSLHEPAIMIKAGDGEKTYTKLPFIQGVAADVPDWAKKSSLTIDSVEGLKESIDTEISSKDTNTTYTFAATSDNHGLQITATEKGSEGPGTTSTVTFKFDDILDNLNLEDETVEHQFITKVTETKGVVTVERAQPTTEDIKGLTEALAAKQDTIAFTGTYTGLEGGKAVSEDTLTEKIEEIKIPEYTIAKSGDPGEYLSKYELQKNGQPVGSVTIDIPKDMVVQSGEVVTIDQDGTEDAGVEEPGTYIKLVLQNVAKPLYINVSDLIEYVTAGTDPDGILTITVSADHKVSVQIQDNKITGTKLVDSAISSAKLAEGAVIESKLAENAVTATAIAAGAVSQEKLESTLSGKINKIDEKADASSLHKIATSGKADDLEQDEGTWLVLNCGDASTLVDPAV